MIKSLKTSRFRNLVESQIPLSPQTTIFVGENGQGKTNILESIYLLSYGKVFRGEKLSTIAWGQESAVVEGETEQDNLQVVLEKSGENQVFLNQKAKGLHDLFGRLVTVLFEPEEISLIAGQPSLRRVFLDKLLSTTDKQYLFSLANYHKALKNKNFLLKTKAPHEQIEAWNEILAREGTKIWHSREEVIQTLNKHLEKGSEKIINKPMKIDYTNPLVGNTKEGVLLDLLEKAKEKERAVGVSFVGPHRDDFEINVEEKNAPSEKKSLAEFGSRAEQRQGAVLLKLSQAEVFRETFSSPPTLLLDDVSSELDAKNRELMLSNVADFQVLITTTDLEFIPEKLKKSGTLMSVAQGKVTAA